MRNAGPQMTIEERMLTPDEKEFLLCVERYFLVQGIIEITNQNTKINLIFDFLILLMDLR